MSCGKQLLHALLSPEDCTLHQSKQIIETSRSALLLFSAKLEGQFSTSSMLSQYFGLILLPLQFLLLPPENAKASSKKCLPQDTFIACLSDYSCLLRSRCITSVNTSLCCTLAANIGLTKQPCNGEQGGVSLFLLLLCLLLQFQEPLLS